jgi:hypothetical protein
MVTLVLSPSLSYAAVAHGAAVTGVVRDVQGVAQAGALVQVIAAGLEAPRTAFTDLHGRYSIANLIPGKYAVQASAALFVPSTKANLELHPGKWAVVNLTLATLFDTSAWLPAERRKADEAGSDWKWTLRSSANRPMLRMVDDDLSGTMASNETETRRAKSQAMESFTSGDGGFGHGGTHNVLSENREMGDGSDAVVRLDIGLLPDTMGSMPATELDAGFERQLGFAGAARTVVSYQMHPELVGSGDVAGVSAFEIASAQQASFGDSIQVEFGSEVYAVRTARIQVGSAPFLRVDFHPAGDWTVGYRLATSQELQGFGDLDSIERELPVAVATAGSMQLEHGRHQELSVTRKAGRGVVQVALYHDNMNHPVVTGGGAVGDLNAAGGAAWTGILSDTSNGSFRFLGPGYSADGFNILISQPISPGMWAAIEYSTGSALSGRGVGDAVSPAAAAATLHSVTGQAATFAVRGRLIRSGTRLRAAYRWQPTGLVTAVDPYRAFSDQAYLSFSVRQPIRFGRLLPPGLEGTVAVTNLLAQGYRPFLSPDGSTLFLAQAPRTIEGGLCLNF